MWGLSTAQLEEVFTRNLDYGTLDERIAKTRENKARRRIRPAQRDRGKRAGYVRHGSGDVAETVGALLRLQSGSNPRDQPGPASGKNHSVAHERSQFGDILEHFIFPTGLIEKIHERIVRSGIWT